MTSHRQGYPFQGCVPTEPWSVSPCADIELYSRLDKQMTFRAYAWKNPGGSGAKPLRDTAIVSLFRVSISFRCSKSFLNRKEDKLNTVATQRSGTRTRTRQISVVIGLAEVIQKMHCEPFFDSRFYTPF
jgi:hypothetical protein